jgi:hypothetical protein
MSGGTIVLCSTFYFTKLIGTKGISFEYNFCKFLNLININ